MRYLVIKTDNDLRQAIAVDKRSHIQMVTEFPDYVCIDTSHSVHNTKQPFEDIVAKLNGEQSRKSPSNEELCVLLKRYLAQGSYLNGDAIRDLRRLFGETT